MLSTLRLLCRLPSSRLITPHPCITYISHHRKSSTTAPITKLKCKPPPAPWTVDYIISLEKLYTRSIREGTQPIEAQAVADLLNRASNDIVPAVTRVVVRNLYVKALRELWGDRDDVVGDEGEKEHGGRMVCTGLDVLLAIKYTQGPGLKRTLEEGFEVLRSFPTGEWGSVEGGGGRWLLATLRTQSWMFLAEGPMRQRLSNWILDYVDGCGESPSVSGTSTSCA